jgi:hypothetical protein
LRAVGAPKRAVIAALLSGGKAQREYVDLTMDAVQFETKKANKDFLLFRLSKTLGINVESAILYLRSNASLERKMLVAEMFAHGLREYPNRASDFLSRVQDVPIFSLASSSLAAFAQT